MIARLRWTIALLVLFLPAVAIAVTWALWQSLHAGQVASHWSGLGTPDASLPALGVFVAALSVAVAAAIGGSLVVALPRARRRLKRATLFWTGTTAGLAAGVWIIPAGLTVQAGSPEQAVLGGWGVVLALTILYGAAPYLIAPPAPQQDDREPAMMPEPLRATETGAWSRTITMPLFLYATLLVVVIAAATEVAILVSGDPGAGIPARVILVAGAVVLASFIRVRITVDWRGLRIVSLLLRLPLRRIRLDSIRRADVADLKASEWGGWGYRIMPGRSALILRSGPGLVVTTTDDRQFALTLADPEVPARLLNSLRAEGAVQDAGSRPPGLRPHA